VGGETSEDAVARVNAAAKQPVLFIHGVWLAPRSWAAWRQAFDAAGYVTLAPPWPVEPASPGVGQVLRHFSEIAGALVSRPAVIGHSFGGLIAQMLAGRGLSAATVAIAPAPFRGVTPLPFSAVKSAWPALRNPANAGRRTSLTEAEFLYAFANAVPPAEGRALFAAQAAPAPGRPLFQAAAANLNPWTQVRVDTRAACRGPLLIMAGERDHTTPPVVVRAAFERQRSNRDAVSEYLEAPGRGHSLTIDAGWREVADAAFSFTQRFI
jgi:non-heme chloroperoxidase